MREEFSSGPCLRSERTMQVNEIVEELLAPVVRDLPFDNGDRVALMVNGLGGTRSVSCTCCTGRRTSVSRSRASR